MTTIIFTASATGHNMEYLHHVYELCIQCPSNRYIFVVPEQFEANKTNFQWTPASHITFDYMRDEELAKYRQGKRFVSAYALVALIKERVKRHQANRLFAITINIFLPFYFLLIRSGVKVSGIMYRVYFYEWKQMSMIQRLIDVVKTWVYARSQVFETIFVLNDAVAVRRFNSLYRSNKFSYLVDPHNRIKEEDSNVIAQQFNIRESDHVFLHFGGLARRKGTLLILDSLEYLTADESQDMVFIFAGSVYKEIKSEFYSKIEKYKSKVRIYVIDQFCSYEYLGALCKIATAIVIPYLITAQSSGVIAYASQYNKPVIAPKSGMIGRLVSRYHLGLSIKCTEKTLVEAYRSVVAEQVPLPTSQYCEEHTLVEFQRQLNVCVK